MALIEQNIPTGTGNGTGLSGKPVALSLASACVLAFMSGAALTMMEMLAFRLTSRYLGTSHYTVASIIGSVLGGLAIGNFIGGVLADRRAARPLLAILFALASVACFVTPIINGIMGDWSALWFLNWPQRVAIHTAITFIIPSAVLGAIGPVTAKAALETGHSRGRIIGDIFAWGTLGSILGTFATGFFLIETLGVFVGSYAVALTLAEVAIVLNRKSWIASIWFVVTAAVLVLTAAPKAPFHAEAAGLGLYEEDDPDTLFDKESPYSHVRIIRDYERPGQLIMLLDKLKHSHFDPAHADTLMYSYERVFSTVMKHAAGTRNDSRVLVLGGGGYTHPRDILRLHSHARIDVAEIDPVVTEAAKTAFGLVEDSRMSITHIDGREYVRQLASAGTKGIYDFVFLDALYDLNVPNHLTTLEFQDMLKQVMKPDGVLMTMMIDLFNEGRLLSAMVQTYRKSFSHVWVFYAGELNTRLVRDQRATFAIVAANRDLAIENLSGDLRYGDEVRNQLIPADEIEKLIQRNGEMVLTDDFSPVEQLLAGVVQRAGGSDAPLRFYHRADLAMRRRRFDTAIRDLQEAVSLKPDFVFAWTNLGICLSETHQTVEAESAFRHAAAIDSDDPTPHRNLGNLCFMQKRFAEAAEAYAESVRRDPGHARTHDLLAKSLGNMGEFSAALRAFERAQSLDPSIENIDANIERTREFARRESEDAESESSPSGLENQRD